MENLEIAAILDELADILEIQGANPFRVRAYRNAVRTLEGLGRRLTDMMGAREPLTALPGVGKEIARHVEELLTTGRLRMLEELWREVPRSVVELVRVGGVGPKRARALWDALRIESVDMLEAEIRAGRVQNVPGFGPRSCEKILRAILDHRTRRGLFLLAEVEPLVETLAAFIRGGPGALEVVAAGSFRRRKAVLGDLDLLARCDGDGSALVAHFAGFPGALRVEAAGGTKGSLVLRSGLQVDLRVIPSVSFGAALHYFTGSKEHNVRVRSLGVRQGLRINEWGIFRNSPEEGEDDPSPGAAPASGAGPDLSRFGERIGGEQEEDVFRALGLAWVPPELREDRGEVEAAQSGRLPELLVGGDIRGDFQMHSTWSDGRHSIETMAAACAELGYAYLAITDHSQSLTMTGGLSPARVREQWSEIEEVREKVPALRLLRSLEVDILRDGSLDMPDEVLEGLDIVVVSVHSFMDMDQATMTERVIRALGHPLVDILAHPTGRLLSRRPPYALDMDAVLQAALEHDAAVELNASPNRLDLADVHVQRARELGVKVAVDTDAHSVKELGFMRYGIEQARRGWLERKDVLNAKPLAELERWLERGIS